MFHLVFFEIATIQVLFVTSFHLTYVMLSFLFFRNMCLWMLFQVCCCCKGFTTLVANERFLVFVNFLMSVEIRFLIETLCTVLVIARVRLFSCVNYFVANQSWLQIELFFTFIIWTSINFVVDIFNFLRTLRTFIVRMPTLDESIICTIAGDALIFLGPFPKNQTLIIVGKASHFLLILIMYGAVLWKKIWQFFRFRRWIGFIFRVFSINVETTFVSNKIHSPEFGSL